MLVHEATSGMNCPSIQQNNMKSIPKPDNLRQQLQAFDALQGVEAAALDWLIEQSDYFFYAEGDYLFSNGEPIVHMTIIVRGNCLLRNEKNGRRRELGTWGAGSITGVLPFSRMEKSGANGVAIDDCQVLRLHRDKFVEMVNVSYALVQSLVAVMTNRVRDFQQMRLMDEKLMALGKMSAGLAHELNNPASAIVRASDELYKQLHLTPERFKEVVTMRVSSEDVDAINEVIFTSINAYDGSNELSLMQQEAFKDDVIDWLDDNDITDAEDLAETFVDFDFGVEALDKVKEILPAEAVGPVLKWIQTNFIHERLIEEIKTSSDRIGSLVRSIKEYSHMDEEPSLELIDVHEGLKSTLTMLMFRFKKNGIEIRKEMNHDIPQITALPGELNQVWTNLIVNALDAMPAQGGILTIRSYQERDCVCVEIEDNGSGIPAEIQSRVFEPFFTTKGIGEGTGMGLDIVFRIINRHQGYINLTSEPGKTCFKVCFPIVCQLKNS